MSEKQYTYEEFLEIIAALRSENGCPWDKVQTHDSLKPCMMEEAAELLASIRIYNKAKIPKIWLRSWGTCSCRLSCMPRLLLRRGCLP